jgi:hypothetical protein
LAAAALTVILAHVGKAEAARALGQDTLQRCHRVLGPEHPITLYLTQVADIDRRTSGNAAADSPNRPL